MIPFFPPIKQFSNSRALLVKISSEYFERKKERKEELSSSIFLKKRKKEGKKN